MRRHAASLARDYVEDAFSFDGRIWRTLRRLTLSPGEAPRRFADGQRAIFTPPVRLFIVMSFILFLSLEVAKVFFVAVEITTSDTDADGILEISSAFENGAREDCALSAVFRIFVRQRDVEGNTEIWDRCAQSLRERIELEIVNDVGADEAQGETEFSEASEFLERLFGSISFAVERPDEFNRAFNVWLPRILLAMTPLFALILAVFIRGPNALLFDHLVFSFYTHAVAFSMIIVAAALVNLGAPAIGYVLTVAIFVYLLLSLKRAYQRGWIKTIWTTLGSSAIYFLLMMLMILVAVSWILWERGA